MVNVWDSTSSQKSACLEDRIAVQSATGMDKSQTACDAYIELTDHKSER
jgi:hypothetical protein